MGNTMRISIYVLAAIALANIASISGQDWFGSKLATGNLTGSIFTLVLMRASAGRGIHTHHRYNPFVFGVFSHRRSSNMASTNCAAGLVLFWVLLSVMVTPITAPLRDTAPNRDDNYHFLTGVTEWNGIPRRDFRHLWFASLIVALGAIFQDGWTLLQTARDEDLGGPANPPPGGVPNAATTVRQSQNRNHRLFHSILKYIAKTSSIYKLATESFNQDGRGLFNYLWTFGYKTPTTKQVQKKEAVWKDASVASLRIRIDEDTPQTWKEWCVDHGSRIGKTLAHIRTKYLEGFPDQFDVVVVPERSSLVNGGAGNYVYPANYPAHFPAALAGNAHPNAGEPDLDTLAQFLSGVWVDMILHGKIKEPPKGTVLQTAYVDDVSMQYTTQAQAFAVNNASSWYVAEEAEKASVLRTGGPELPIYPGSPNEGALPDSTQGGLFSAYQVMPMMYPTTGRVRNHVFAVKRDSINARTLCFVCGGRGHVARMDGKTCSTLEMGVEVPKSLLEATIYSDGVEYPKFKPRSDKSSYSRDRRDRTQRAVVRIAAPARRPSGYDSSGSRSKARVQEVAPVPAPPEDESTDSEDSKNNAHMVEIAMDFGGIQI